MRILLISFIALIACCSNVIAQDWIQKGNDIEGSGEFASEGASVALSADGNTIAVGASYEFDPVAFTAGYVRVLDWNGSDWEQRGSVINSGFQFINDWFGETISLSADGNTIAIGAPGVGVAQVYSWDGFSWAQLGSDILSYAWSVDLDNSGTIIALQGNQPAMTGEDVIKVYMYDSFTFDWIQIAPDILSEEPSENAGMSVSISGNASALAYGSPNNSGNGAFGGSVRTYDTGGFQMGSEINGLPGSSLGNSSSGTALSFNNSGNIMAIGDRFWNASTGEVKVYEFLGDWVQKGASFDGNGATGESVELSSDGDRIIIGNHTSNLSAGSAKTYEWDGSAWQQYGQEVIGEFSDDLAGNCVSMSHDGLTIAIGSHGNDDVATDAGQTRVYTYCGATFSTISPSACLSYTVPSGDETYTASGTYTDTIPNINGCDSLITIILNFDPITSTDIQTACNSYTWTDGNLYTSSDSTATQTLTTTAGCDSVVTLNLTINYSNTSTDFQTACDSFTWIDGNTYTSSDSSATHTLATAAGCDSVVTLNLVINSVIISVTQEGAVLAADEPGSEYQWLNCPDMTPISEANGQSYEAPSEGAYAVIVTNNGCSDTSDCYTVTPVGIIQNGFESELLLYPNPGDGNFSVDLGENYQAVTVTITDLSERLILSNIYYDSRLLNLQLEEPAGFYLLMIESGDKKAVIRLVIE
jgi:hypothetical protein